VRLWYCCQKMGLQPWIARWARPQVRVPCVPRSKILGGKGEGTSRICGAEGPVKFGAGIFAAFVVRSQAALFDQFAMQAVRHTHSGRLLVHHSRPEHRMFEPSTSGCRPLTTVRLWARKAPS